MCSLKQRRAVFAEHAITEARWAQEGPMLLADPALYCCLGDAAYPWGKAAPAVLGCLAFPGYPWQASLGPGLPMAAEQRLRRSVTAQQVLTM